MAQTQPHTTFAAFTHGMANKWTFLSHTITHIGHLLQPLDTIIRTKLIPFLTRRLPPNNVTHDLFALRQECLILMPYPIEPVIFQAVMLNMKRKKRTFEH